MKLILEAIKSLLREINRKLDALTEKAVPADWNQNDETAPDYVKGRTHYTEEGDVKVASGQVASLADNKTKYINVEGDGQYTEFYQTDCAFNADITIGETYVVQIGTKKFEMQASWWINAYDPQAYAGFNLVNKMVNRSLTVTSNYPFVICGDIDAFSIDSEAMDGTYHNCDFAVYLHKDTFSDQLPCDVKITRKGEVVHPLDEKYIPDTIARESLGISGAKVGQSLRVAAVDENGAPTAWEVVD